MRGDDLTKTTAITTAMAATGRWRQRWRRQWWGKRQPERVYKFVTDLFIISLVIFYNVLKLSGEDKITFHSNRNLGKE
jgi:hypothetical protein